MNEVGFRAEQMAKTRALMENGKMRAAVSALWYAEAAVRSGKYLDELGEMLDLATDLQEQCTGSVRADCGDLARQLQDIAERHQPPPLIRDALAVVTDCRVVAVAGLPLKPDADRPYVLAFADDRVVLVERGRWGEEIAIGWDGLSVTIEGAGAVTSGGGFFGGGIGLEGIAVGMLAAAALNALTTRTGIETIIHLETSTAELYLYHGLVTPDVLRRHLAPAFLRLRQQAAADVGSGDHVIDRLSRLGDLLERGLIDQDEFAKLKAELIR